MSSPVLPPLPEPYICQMTADPEGTPAELYFADDMRAYALAAIASQGDAVDALRRLERAVDLHLGRSAWTQTRNLKGFAYSEEVRKELFSAHDNAREILAKDKGSAT